MIPGPCKIAYCRAVPTLPTFGIDSLSNIFYGMETKSTLMKEFICDCAECQDLCKRVPCMGTPKEIQAIIAKGYAYPNHLIVSHDNDPILEFTVVRPRGSRTDNPTQGACVFYKNGKCVLHDVGLKPVEGRVAIHDRSTPRLLYHHLKRAWNTKLGRQLIQAISNENAASKKE